MALPAAKYPAALYDGNEQTQPVLPPGGTDIANADDYNQNSTEIVAVETDLRAANVNGGKPNHADVHNDQEARIAALEAAPGGGGPDEFIVKSVDESVANSGTLQNDDELFFSVAAGDVWVVSLMIHFVEPGISLKYTIDIDSGVPAVGRFNNPQSTAGVKEFGGLKGVPGSGLSIVTEPIHIILDNTGGAASVVRFRWAQTVADPTPVVVKKGSSLLAWKK